MLLLPLMLGKSGSETKSTRRPRIVVIPGAFHHHVKPAREEIESSNLIGGFSAVKQYDNFRELVKPYFYSKCTCRFLPVYPVAYQRHLLISAVFLVMLVRELAARLPSSEIIISAANPGLCHSDMRNNAPFVRRIRLAIFCFFFARQAEVGARQITWAAVARPHCEERLHGRYVSDMEIKEESDFAMSTEGFEVQQKLWVNILCELRP